MSEPMTAQPTVSDAGRELYDAIRQWQPPEVDAENDWATLLFGESVCAPGLQKVYDVARDTDAGPGWSQLVDLNRCRDGDLPFIGQFVGVTVPQGATAAQAKDLILTRPASARGRPATILSAVAATLSGSQHVSIAERDTSAYHATITVFRAQVIDEVTTLAAIAAAKPGMLVVDLNIVDGPTYGDTKIPLPPDPTYGDREAEFPTYGDIREYVP